MPPKVSIIIPAYNEEKTIATLLEKVIAQSRRWNCQIIVVNDGSTDGTLDAIKGFLNQIVLVNLPKNQGKGKAIREGLKKAMGDIVILQDADLELDPADYPRLLAPILEGKTEVVYGARMTKQEHKNTLFFWGGQGITIFANMLYGIRLTDETNGYKIMRRELFESLKLESDGFEICSEITAKIAKRKIPIYEVSVSYYPRSSTEGKKLKIRHGLKSAWALIKYKFIS